MFEEHKKQFAASAQTRNEVKGSGDGSREVPQYKPPDKQHPEKPPEEQLMEALFHFESMDATSANR